jgi:putative FmdB family regulatory protein
MPVYEFLCRDCDTRFDDLVSMSAPLDDQSCPGCRSAEVVKLYSPFSVRSSTGQTISVDGTAVPAGRGSGGGCCGGGCGGCG